MSLKKSETLEVRLSHPLKEAFMARCRADGGSASETLRALIEGYLAPAPIAGFSRWLRLLAAAATVLCVGAVAAPSLARPSPKAVFAAMDARHVGQISFSDFAASATVGASVSLPEKGPPPKAFGLMLGANPLPHRVHRLDAALRQAILRQEFDRIDTDHDGAINFEEFRRYYGG